MAIFQSFAQTFPLSPERVPKAMLKDTFTRTADTSIPTSPFFIRTQLIFLSHGYSTTPLRRYKPFLQVQGVQPPQPRTAGVPSYPLRTRWGFFTFWNERHATSSPAFFFDRLRPEMVRAGTGSFSFSSHYGFDHGVCCSRIQVFKEVLFQYFRKSSGPLPTPYLTPDRTLLVPLRRPLLPSDDLFSEATPVTD